MADLSTGVELEVGGLRYGGWKAVDVFEGMEELAGTFNLTVSEMWPAQREARDIPPGSRVTVKVGGEVVITGYTDDQDIEYSDESDETRVSGRDATMDLVDCAAMFKTGQWDGQKLDAIARDAAAPFGVRVSAATDVGEEFTSVNLNPGETVFELLERLARQRGVLLVSDGLGGLKITRASSRRIATPLVRGGQTANIRAASSRFSFADRFSRYLVTGQTQISDEVQLANFFALAEDKAVGRYRPTVVILDENGDTSGAQVRADWERNVRAARSRTVEVTVSGWHHRDGLWRKDHVVHVFDRRLRLDREMYISGVRFTEDEDDGRSAHLTLTYPEAFSRIPIPDDSGADL